MKTFTEILALIEQSNDRALIRSQTKEFVKKVKTMTFDLDEINDRNFIDPRPKLMKNLNSILEGHTIKHNLGYQMLSGN